MVWPGLRLPSLRNTSSVQLIFPCKSLGRCPLRPRGQGWAPKWRLPFKLSTSTGGGVHQRGSCRSLLLEEKGKTQNLTHSLYSHLELLGGYGCTSMRNLAPSTGCFTQRGIRHHTGAPEALIVLQGILPDLEANLRAAPAVLTSHAAATHGPRPGKQIYVHSPYDPGNSG